MKALEHHTDHAGAAYIINEMIERMKMIRNASAMFVALTLFLLALPVSAARSRSGLQFKRRLTSSASGQVRQERFAVTQSRIMS